MNKIQKVREESKSKFTNHPFVYVQFPAHCVRFEGMDSGEVRFSGMTVDMESKFSTTISNILSAIEAEVENEAFYIQNDGVLDMELDAVIKLSDIQELLKSAKESITCN